MVMSLMSGQSPSVHGHDQRACEPVYRRALSQRQPDLGVGNLARSAFASQLANDLDGVHPMWHAAVTVRQKAAVGIARHGSAEPRLAFAEVFGAFTDLAEAEFFK